mmetsp:Transcript_13603/g.29125  ORF Transcript_13603/g.29125 Transcript_13603/m.29125 type:complete len:198 (-) Transcript_13603:492-1085(-)|eukprot:CAMPEP_0202904662 /NCGR_PEP_ID=MMETSP1392-20130828/30518_1 /ASSEMBLY_ACC=CAM_ASM_000868 /TAXON_ID=225041 /ORGANISM="Chlamydomonas chlamydogama, Strain SAG 11-48b" /LENGTH=197 /DNA_ID=CAMNT_0049592413 /DNA_START=159 /DNA_END=752 /DNA_ORIENTATION=+
MVTNQMPFAKQVMQLSAQQGSESDLQELSSKVKHLEARLAELEAKATDRSRRGMLGEAAYMLDKAACAYVFWGETYLKGMTIDQLEFMACYGKLTDVQKARWTKFCGFLQCKGWPINDVCTVSNVVKELRREVGPAKEEDKASVTLEQLNSWVDTEMTMGTADDCKELLQLVSSFGRDGKPLVLGEVVQIVDSQTSV